MKRLPVAFVMAFLLPISCWAQISGNAGYAQPGSVSKAEQNERAKRTLTRDEMSQKSDSMFLDASVLMNVKADEYVAVFGVMREGATVEESQKKMDAAVQEFTNGLKALGVAPGDIFVDYIAQNKVYGYDVTSDVAKEKLTGFELKKNISIHYKDYGLVDKFVSAAAKLQIYDLIKVDYIIKNTPELNAKLMVEAAQVMKQKAVRYEKLFNLKLKPAQILAERPSIYYPSELYSNYNAYESEDVNSGYYRQKYVIQNARKSRTFYYNGLNADGFDLVINPVTIEPMVQCTLYLKARYETASAPKSTDSTGKGKHR